MGHGRSGGSGWAGCGRGGRGWIHESGRSEEILLGRGSNLYPMDLGEIQHLIQE